MVALGSYESPSRLAQHEERIARAASASNLSVSTFVLGATTCEAERVLGRDDHALMPAGQFDALVCSFDQSDSAPRLQQAAAAKRHREFLDLRGA